MTTLTSAQKSALKWLVNRGGEGVFNKHQVLLAQGELAGVMRSTWNILCDEGMVLYSANKGYKRVFVTAHGRREAELWGGKEAGTVEDKFDDA